MKVHDRRDIRPHPPDTPERLFERAERQAAARKRLRVQRHRLITARLADEAMPLSVYYGPRPLLAIPLSELLGGGGSHD